MNYKDHHSSESDRSLLRLLGNEMKQYYDDLDSRNFEVDIVQLKRLERVHALFSGFAEEYGGKVSRSVPEPKYLYASVSFKSNYFETADFSAELMLLLLESDGFGIDSCNDGDFMLTVNFRIFRAKKE